MAKPLLTRSCCLVAGCLLPLAFSPYDLYLIAVLSPAVLFIAWLKSQPKEALVCGYLYGFGMFATGVNWLHISINLFGGVNLAGSLLLTLLLVLFLALYPAFAGFMACRLFRSRGTLFLTLVIPSMWTLSEWFREWILTGFPWLNLGNSQINSPLAGYASLLGVYGVSFAVCFSAGCMVNLKGKGWRSRMGTVISVSILWLAGYQLLQYQWTRMEPDSLTVTLVQGAIPQEVKWNPEQRQRTLELYLGLTEAHWDSDIIIWPETAIPALYHQQKDFIDLLDARAELHDTAFLTGIPYMDKDTQYFYNSILLLGKEDDIYHKHHLVPFGEYLPLKNILAPFVYFLKIPMSDFSPGAENVHAMETRKAIFGLTICYEDTFGKEVIKSLPRATLLLNVSNDAWFGDSVAPHQHLQIARMRALETGRYLLRATNTGITAIIDHKGRIVARSPQFEALSLTAEAFNFHGSTPYVTSGNALIVMLCLVILVSCFTYTENISVSRNRTQGI